MCCTFVAHTHTHVRVQCSGPFNWALLSVLLWLALRAVFVLADCCNWIMQKPHKLPTGTQQIRPISRSHMRQPTDYFIPHHFFSWKQVFVGDMLHTLYCSLTIIRRQLCVQRLFVSRATVRPRETLMLLRIFLLVSWSLLTSQEWTM